MFSVVAFLLFLFSYTQVDLNLTLSRASVVATIQQSFQYVGYYQRSTASFMYLGIIIAFFALYSKIIYDKKILARSLWHMIYVVTIILVFSYPAAFSYDFFNYLFTAKTVFIYHQNPYVVTPLQFTSIDPWINFMRWTHLTTAYAPFWILLSIIPFVFGFGYFIPVLFFTKFMIAGFYLMSCWMIFKITKSTQSLAIFALNPLILLETLVSGHNDIVLIAFALVAIYFLHINRLTSWVFLSISIATKLMTIFLIPVFLFNKKYIWMLVAMIIGLVFVISNREFLPWYWVWIVPFVALMPEKKWIVHMCTAMSFGLLLSYAPYFYFGHYNLPVPVWKLILTWSPMVYLGLFYLLKKFLKLRVAQ